MVLGVVKFFLADKGYGFIIPEDGSKDQGDVYVHQVSVRSGAPPH